MSELKKQDECNLSDTERLVLSSKLILCIEAILADSAKEPTILNIKSVLKSALSICDSGNEQSLVNIGEITINGVSPLDCSDVNLFHKNYYHNGVHAGYICYGVKSFMKGSSLTMQREAELIGVLAKCIEDTLKISTEDVQVSRGLKTPFAHGVTRKGK